MSNSNPHCLEVGQKLWFVPRIGWGSPREVTITDVRQLWASLNERMHVRLDNLEAHIRGEYPPGRCYLSKEDYDASPDALEKKCGWQQPWKPPLDGVQYANQQAWDALRSVLAQQYTIPPDIDLRDVADAAETLGMGEQFRREVERMKR